ncbi:MAG: hypothetical protein ACLU70_07425 [Lachnospira sp.]
MTRHMIVHLLRKVKRLTSAVYFYTPLQTGSNCDRGFEIVRDKSEVDDRLRSMAAVME